MPPRGKRKRDLPPDLADFAGADADREAIEKLSAAAKANNEKAGHNHELTEGQFSAQYMLIAAARLEWIEMRDKAREAYAVLGNRYKVAKSSGIDIDVLKAIFKIKEGGDARYVSDQRTMGKYLRWMGSPLGTQFGLFDFLDADKPPPGEPRLAGEHAYKNSEPRDNNPHKPGTEEFVKWFAGYDDAMQATARSMA